jgi:hypothetical protein
MKRSELEERRLALRRFVDERLLPLERELPVEGLPDEPLQPRGRPSRSNGLTNAPYRSSTCSLPGSVRSLSVPFDRGGALFAIPTEHSSREADTIVSYGV